MFPRQLQRTVSRALSPNAIKIHQRPPMLFGFWFPHKNLRSHPPTPWKSMLRTQHKMKWIQYYKNWQRHKLCSRTWNTVWCHNMKHISALKDIHCQSVFTKKAVFEVCKNTTNRRATRWRVEKRGQRSKEEYLYITETRRTRSAENICTAKTTDLAQ